MHRTIWRLITTYITIAMFIYLCEAGSMWFYPLAVLVLAHQYYSLSLIGHEGVHGLLHKNTFINAVITRYLCFMPIFVSFNHYSLSHLRHHRYLGTPNDPDIPLFQNSYRSFYHWIQSSIINILNLNFVRFFMHYFNGSIDFTRGKYPHKISSDLPVLLPIWTLVLIFIVGFHLYFQFLIYWVLPIVIVLPWLHLGNSYQHFSENGPIPGYATTVLVKNKWLSELLFPLNINYHEVHHQHPDIPYYLLPKYLQDTPNTFDFVTFSKKILNSQTSKS